MKNLSNILLGFFITCGSICLLGCLLLATDLPLFASDPSGSAFHSYTFITLVIIFGAVAILAFFGLLTLSIIEFIKSKRKNKE